LKGFKLENVYIFYGHLEYFTDIWDSLLPFGIFSGYWSQEKPGNPASNFAKQGCQMVSFLTKTPTMGILWRTLE
jgi:hypothetical protein